MLISKSMERLIESFSTIRRIFERRQELASLYGAENVYDFSRTAPAAPVPYEVKNAIISILENQDSGLVHGYTSNAGYREVRERIAEQLNRKYSMQYEAESVIMTSGAAGALNIAMRTLLSEGDELICFAPFVPEYRSYAMNYGAVLKTVPADIENYQLNIAAAEELIGTRTRALIINNPNNPSGSVYTEQTIKELGEMLERAEKRVGHPLYLICDESYRELVYDGIEVPHTPHFIKNAIYIYSFSKTLSIPGERIGCLALRRDADSYEELISAMIIANRCLGYINAPSLFQLVVGDCLDVKADTVFYDRNRRLIYSELSSMGFECILPEGGFYLCIKAPGGDSEVFTHIAEKHHIIMVQTDDFGLPGYVRIAYCVPYELIEASLSSFRALSQECGK